MKSFNNAYNHDNSLHATLIIFLWHFVNIMIWIFQRLQDYLTVSSAKLIYNGVKKVLIELINTRHREFRKAIVVNKAILPSITAHCFVQNCTCVKRDAQSLARKSQKKFFSF